MPDTHRNRLQTTVSAVASSGTGQFTISSAVSGFRTFDTNDDGKTFSCLFIEGTAWEVATGCTYTHNGGSSPTLSRGTLENSSTGSAVTFTSAAIVSVIAPASFGNAAVLRDSNGNVAGETFLDYREKLHTATTSGNLTVSLANGNVQRITLDAARQISMPADPGAVGVSFVLILNCASFTPTWGSSPTITWLTAGGTAPTLNTTSGKRNVLTFVWDDNGGGTGTWMGFLGGKET